MNVRRWLIGLVIAGSAGLAMVSCADVPEESEDAPDARAAAVIALSSGIIDTSRPVPEPPSSLRARPAAADEQEILLLKFPGPVTTRQTEAMRAGDDSRFPGRRPLPRGARDSGHGRG